MLRKDKDHNSKKAFSSSDKIRHITISQIKFMSKASSLVGSGGVGCVLKAKYQDKIVAVKSFALKSERAYKNELAAYK